MNNALTKLGEGLKEELIFKYLISKNEADIREQNLSIFGYESLYKSIQEKTIDIKEHGLFHEPRLFDIDSERELKKELDRNAHLSKKIASTVRDFGDDPSELQRQLEDIGLSERFIRNQFIGQNKNEYKKRTFAEIENEIERNKDRKLDLVNVELNGEKFEQWKRLSETGAARKNISLVGEVIAGNIELKIRMTRGEPLLKAEQISTHGDLKQNQIILSTSNHDLHSTLNVKIPFDGKPIFVQLKFKRPSQRECFQFNCCFVEKEKFYIGNYFEKLEVEIKRNNGKLILENIQGQLALDSEKENIHIVTDTDTKINCDDIGIIDFSELDEEDALGDFELASNKYSLPITITGKKLIESIKLPSLFDPNRNMDVFEIERSPKYKPSNSRIIINGREKELSVKAKELCTDEYKFISEGVVYFDDIPSNTIYLDDLKNEFPKVVKAYQELYAWLTKQETLLSITNWPPKLLELLELFLIHI